MSKKIIIVGALGYLGTELCKLYSGESWFHNIVAIDFRFLFVDKLKYVFYKEDSVLFCLFSDCYYNSTNIYSVLSVRK